jgi:hypothetical protein
MAKSSSIGDPNQRVGRRDSNYPTTPGIASQQNAPTSTKHSELRQKHMTVPDFVMQKVLTQYCVFRVIVTGDFAKA